MALQFDPFYQEYLDTLAAYTLAASIAYTDQATIAPAKGLPYSNKMLSILSSRAFAYENNPETIEKIKAYSASLPENSLEKREVDWRLKELAKTREIPAADYQRYVKAKADAEMMWRKAKEENNYALFQPYLQDLMKQSLHLLSFDPDYSEEKRYDLLLDSHEKGMNQEKYDAFFAVIKEELPPLIKEIRENGRRIDTSFLEKTFDVEKQAAFSRKVLEFLGADFDRLYLTTTEHPFTNFISHNDIRISTHYYPERFLSAVLSTIHEYGHALYALQMKEEYDGTMFKNGIGSGAHESQSRFLENHIGRSLPFWKAIYPSLTEIFPEFKEITPEELYDMINITENGLIRTEADELTYPLHILIRYELEKEMADGTLDYDALPEKWAQKYEEYLGIRPETDAEGVLQDMHWSAGYLGYFPTYALGSAMAAQLYEKMAQDLNVEELLLTGNFAPISAWLEENVHQYAGEKTMMEITEEVSGKPFDPHIYTNSLKNKYRTLYNLQ